MLTKIYSNDMINPNLRSGLLRITGECLSSPAKEEIIWYKPYEFVLFKRNEEQPRNLITQHTESTTNSVALIIAQLHCKINGGVDMSQRFTITGFKTYCSNMGFRMYKYNTLNQIWLENNFKAVLLFKELIVSLSPDRIYLKGDSGHIGFQKVRYINKVSNSSGIDNIFDIVCDNLICDYDGEREVTYRITAEL